MNYDNTITLLNKLIDGLENTVKAKKLECDEAGELEFSSPSPIKMKRSDIDTRWNTIMGGTPEQVDALNRRGDVGSRMTIMLPGHGIYRINHMQKKDGQPDETISLEAVKVSDDIQKIYRQPEETISLEAVKVSDDVAVRLAQEGCTPGVPARPADPCSKEDELRLTIENLKLELMRARSNGDKVVLARELEELGRARVKVDKEVARLKEEAEKLRYLAKKLGMVKEIDETVDRIIKKGGSNEDFNSW